MVKENSKFSVYLSAEKLKKLLKNAIITNSKRRIELRSIKEEGVLYVDISEELFCEIRGDGEISVDACVLYFILEEHEKEDIAIEEISLRGDRGVKITALNTVYTLKQLWKYA